MVAIICTYTYVGSLDIHEEFSQHLKAHADSVDMRMKNLYTKGSASLEFRRETRLAWLGLLHFKTGCTSTQAPKAHISMESTSPNARKG